MLPRTLLSVCSTTLSLSSTLTVTLRSKKAARAPAFISAFSSFWKEQNKKQEGKKEPFPTESALFSVFISMTRRPYLATKELGNIIIFTSIVPRSNLKKGSHFSVFLVVPIQGERTMRVRYSYWPLNSKTGNNFYYQEYGGKGKDINLKSKMFYKHELKMLMELLLTHRVDF